MLINISLSILLAGGAGVAYLSLNDSAGATARLVSVTRGTLLSSVSASGSVASANSRGLAFTTSGTVNKINVAVGDKVKAGQVLATIDDSAAQDTLQSAKAALSAAEAAGTSTAALYSTYVSAKASYDSAQRQVAGCQITAPFGGTIISVAGTVGGPSGASSSSSSGSNGTGGGSGSNGTGGTGGSGGNGNSSSSSSSSSANSSTGSSSTGSSSGGFITLADTSHLQVRGQFTESDVTKIQIGQQASVSFDALSGTTASGKVTEIDQTSTTTNNVVQYGVTVALADPPSAVRIGATATVQVITSKADNTLLVPTAAVRTVAGQSTVTVMRNGKQVTQPVQIGTQGDTGTQIVSGLNAGDRVMITTSSTGGTGFPAGRLGGGLTGGLGGLNGGRG